MALGLRTSFRVLVFFMYCFLCLWEENGGSAPTGPADVETLRQRREAETGGEKRTNPSFPVSQLFSEIFSEVEVFHELKDESK